MLNYVQMTSKISISFTSIISETKTLFTIPLIESPCFFKLFAINSFFYYNKKIFFFRYVPQNGNQFFL